VFEAEMTDVNKENENKEEVKVDETAGDKQENIDEMKDITPTEQKEETEIEQQEEEIEEEPKPKTSVELLTDLLD
jgi:hypothetical protein